MENNGNGAGSNVTPSPAHNQSNAAAHGASNGLQTKPMVSMMRQGGQAQMGTPLANPDHGAAGPSHGLAANQGVAQNAASGSELMNSRKQKFLN